MDGILASGSAAETAHYKRLSVLLFVATAALFSSFQGVQGVLVPASVAALAPLNKVPALGLLTTLSAVTTSSWIEHLHCWGSPKSESPHP